MQVGLSLDSGKVHLKMFFIRKCSWSRVLFLEKKMNKCKLIQFYQILNDKAFTYIHVNDTLTRFNTLKQDIIQSNQILGNLLFEQSQSGHRAPMQRHINVNATSLRCIDVVATLYERHVSAGLLSKQIFYCDYWLMKQFRSTFQKCVLSEFFQHTPKKQVTQIP